MLTYDPSAERLAGLQAATDNGNAQRAIMTPPLPPLTAEEYWTNRNDFILDSYVKELVKGPTVTKIKEALDAASPKELADAAAALKVSV